MLINKILYDEVLILGYPNMDWVYNYSHFVYISVIFEKIFNKIGHSPPWGFELVSSTVDFIYCLLLTSIVLYQTYIDGLHHICSTILFQLSNKLGNEQWMWQLWFSEDKNWEMRRNGIQKLTSVLRIYEFLTLHLKQTSFTQSLD